MSRGKRQSPRSQGKMVKQFVGIIIAICLGISIYFGEDILGTTNVTNNAVENNTVSTSSASELTQSNINLSIENIPEYAGDIYVEINNNVPYFEESEYTTESFEKYSELDELGRCGVAYANICKETMPVDGEERESISNVKPTGWVQAKYDGEYLYNRCHLIGYQLSAENANENNLITGTRYFNVEGMLPFENRVAEYIEQNPNNHVLYRVTPIFEGDNLLANGVEMEAYSVEDNGQGISFNVFVYNIQPEVTINYATGESSEL